MEPIAFNIPEPRKIRKAITPDQRKFVVMPLRAIRDRTLSLEDLRTLGLLCSYASKAGFSHVSQDRLARDTNRKLQAINRNMKNLERKGYYQEILHSVVGLRGAVKRIIYDDSLTADDVATITNESIDPFTIQQERQHYMTTVKPTRRGRPAKNKQPAVEVSLTFLECCKLVDVKDEIQLLQIERLYHDNITATELLNAWKR